MLYEKTFHKKSRNEILLFFYLMFSELGVDIIIDRKDAELHARKLFYF